MKRSLLRDRFFFALFSLIVKYKAGFFDGVCPKVESYYRRIGFIVKAKTSFFESVNRNDILMDSMAHRRTRSSVACLPITGDALNTALRRFSRRNVSSTCNEVTDIGGNIKNKPMPPPAARGCIRIVHRDCKTFCAFWGIFP